MFKIIHMAAGSIILLLLLVRVIQFLLGKIGTGNTTPADKLMFILPHLLYTILVISGVWQLVILYHATTSVPYWIIAKIILFIVAVSAGFKMTRSTASRKQYKAGLIVACIAYACIIGLIITKPTLSKSTSITNNMPVNHTLSPVVQPYQP